VRGQLFAARDENPPAISVSTSSAESTASWYLTDIIVPRAIPEAK
jgi:hypothetical protein